MKVKIVCYLLFLVGFSHVFSKTAYRPKKIHHVVGFYPTNKYALKNELEDHFGKAKKHFGIKADPNLVRAMIVPHAGYYFSGLCAASAYQTLLVGNSKNKRIKRVIILAPSHSVGFAGIALPDYLMYETPISGIKIDINSIEQLSQNPLFKPIPKVHDLEHSLEVQLPFLQTAIQDFEIVPLIVGALSEWNFDVVANELGKIIDENTLVVVSSDFTHHGSNYGYKKFDKNIFYNVRRLDSLAIEAILDKSYFACDEILKRTGVTVCGKSCIKILLKIIEKGFLGDVEGRMTSYYTSPQVSAARKSGFDHKKLFENIDDDLVKNSVSYAGIVFSKEKLSSLDHKDRLSNCEQLSLLRSARDSIENEFYGGSPGPAGHGDIFFGLNEKSGVKKLDKKLLAPILTPQLKKKSGAFVTLNTKKGDLRGCIGNILPVQPLYLTVLDRAKSAAFEDKRFPSLKKHELDDVVIDITVLEEPRKVKSYNDIVLGRHGIILKKKGRSAVFLPQVAPSFGWDLPTTLSHLSRKTGLQPDAWKQDCDFEVFEGFEFKE